MDRQTSYNIRSYLLCRSPHQKLVFELESETIVLAFNIETDININDPNPKNHYARLVKRANSYVLEPLDTANSTFVNGKRLSAPHKLITGDVIALDEFVTLIYKEVETGELEVQLSNDLNVWDDKKLPPDLPDNIESMKWLVLLAEQQDSLESFAIAANIDIPELDIASFEIDAEEAE